MRELLDLIDSFKGDKESKTEFLVRETIRLSSIGDSEARNLLNELLIIGRATDSDAILNGIYKDAYESTLFENGNDK